MKKRITKTLIYKQARFAVPGLSLQALLQQALKQFPEVIERHRPLDDTGTGFHAWNHHRQSQGMLFGELVHYTQGEHQQLLAMSPHAQEHELEQVPPPTKDDGKQREFLSGALFFGVIENHIVLVQGQSLLSRDFERYLRWLIQDRAQTLPQDTGLFVADNPSQRVRDRVKRQHVRSIAVGSELLTRPATEESVSRHHVHGRAADVLRALLGDRWLPIGGFEQSLDEANLQVLLEIRYKRKTTVPAQQLLDDIAVALRHQDPEDTEIRLQGGGVIKGDDLKLSTRVSFDGHNGALDRTALCERMREWLYQTIDNGDAPS